MPTVISGDGTITGLVAGGLTDGIITQAELATGVAGTGPAFLVYLSAHQAPANNTVVKVAFDTKVYDTASCFNTSTNRFTPTVAGYYQINGTLAGYSSNTSLSTLYAYMEKNGSYVAASGVINVPTCLSVATVVSQVIYMNGSTDYLELFGQINATGSSQLFLGTGLVYSTFSGSLIRAA